MPETVGAPKVLHGARFVEPRPPQEVMPLAEGERNPDLDPERDPTTADTLEVFVVRSDDEPVDSAVLELVGDGWRRLASTTGADGHASIRVAAGSPKLIVSAAGLRSETISLTAEVLAGADAALRVVLIPGASLSGTVTWLDSRAAAAEATVHAWRAGYPPGSTGPPDPSGTREDYLASTSGSNGEFELGGLDSGGTYTLTATLPGGVARRRVSATAPDRGVTLEIVPAFAAHIIFEETGGDALRTSPEVFGRGIFWDASADPASTFLHGKELELTLLSKGRIRRSRLGRDRLTLVLTRSERAPFAGPVQVEADVPGYAPVWILLRAIPVGPESAAVRVGMERSAEGWASLMIHCSGVSRFGGAPSSEGRPVGVLELTDLASGTPVRIAVTDSMWGAPELVKSVPVGDYESRVTFTDWSFSVPGHDDPPLVLQVRSESIEELVLPEQFAGAAVLSPILDGSDPYRGSLTIRLQQRLSDEAFTASTVSFERAPYVLPALPAGEYEVVVTRVLGRTLASDSVYGLTIDSGAVTLLDLDISSSDGTR